MGQVKKSKPGDVRGSTGNSGGPSRSTVVRENKDDGAIDITFLQDDLEVRADFIPPRGKGAPITVDYISALLEKLNLVYGVSWETLQRTAMECSLERRLIKNVLVARGDEPAAEVAGYYERNPHWGEKGLPVPGDEEKGRIDFRSYSPFIIVKKDQILARLRPRKTGKEGKNVHGETIPYPVIRPEGVLGGENTRTEGACIYAEINGQLVETGNTLHVRNSLVINGPVGYGTGNIIFPGDVVIEGPVSDGFKIYSGGSVTIKQTFDVTDAVTKTDLLVAGGIIGRGRALVKVGGNLKAKFIENCRVACRKTITVDSEIINSSVFTMENLDMGDKGIILGGEIYAIHGVRAGGIGKKTGRATTIHCGVDFTIQQEKEKNNNRLRILAAKLDRLRERMAEPEPDPERLARMEELLQRLTEEQRKAAARISELLGRVNQDETAAVTVSGEIAPGTLIEICQVGLFVTEPLRRVKIRLDKPNGKLITEGIG